jgi:cobalt-zinc-cadmium efflux system outer membrane protein
MRVFLLPAVAFVLASAAACEPGPPRASLTVDDAVTEMLSNNLGLLAERANVGIAEARIITAGLRPNPVLSVGADHLDALGTKFDEVNGGGPSEMNLRTDFAIERGGKRRLRVEVARQAHSVAELNFVAAARSLILDTQNAFLDATVAKDSLRLARQDYETFQRIVEINTAREKAGDLAKVELTRLRLAALQARNGVRTGELRWRSALTRLAALLGRSDPNSLRDIEGEPRRDPDVPAIDALLKRSREQRSDIQALRGELARAAAEVNLQQAGAKQDLTVGTEYRRQQGVNGKSSSVGVFLEVPLPVFNRNQGEIARAMEERRQAELRLRARERVLAGEVDDAYQQYLTARELLGAIEGTMIEQAREVRDTTEYAYKRGDATLLQLFDARRAFNETMQSYHDARGQYARSLYLIDSVTGKAVKP